MPHESKTTAAKLVWSIWCMTPKKFQESVLWFFLVLLCVENNIPKVYQNLITTKGLIMTS